MRALGFAALLVLAWSAPVRAEWLNASSDHFLIYADESERDLTSFAQKLERYHSALALLTGNNAAAPSPSNRVTIYVLRNVEAVRKLYGGGSQYLGGFYLPRAGGSVAIVPETLSGYGSKDEALTVLLHEYAHHFLISYDTMQAPRWMSEGAAEFFSATKFQADGGMLLGGAAQHRANELFHGTDVKAADLLDPTAYDNRKNKSYDAFYGKSWLLYHYLTFNRDKRKDQLSKYVALLAEGVDPPAAAQRAFGDFGVLEKELDAYMRARLSVLALKATELKTGAITIRRLSPGEAAMMPVVIRSRRGVDRDSAKLVVAQARKIAAKFPDDAAVLSALAEAEHDAGNDAEALAAADAAIARDRTQVNAYVQKGQTLFRMASDAKTEEAEKATYQRAMNVFVALNHLENDHPLPLIYFYRNQVQQGQQPSALALKGLRRASELAPFDLGLRMMLAMALFQEGRKAEASVALAAVAFDPHGGELAGAARKVLEKVKREPSWNGKDAAAVLTSEANAPGDEPTPAPPPTAP